MANEGNLTMLNDMINPEVMADMIDAKITNAIAFTPFATVDRTLAGRPGDTITIPRWKYIGDAVDVAEGEPVPVREMQTDSDTATVKKAGNAVELTDEAVLSGLGNPVGQATSQLGKSIASKIDTDCYDALCTASTAYTATGIISYDTIVNAIDVFGEELNSEKVMFVHPKQVTQLRLDPNFISADKYTGDVVMTGEIGKIANTRIVASRRVETKSNKYVCPIVKITKDTRTEDDLPTLTIFLKRDTQVETPRDAWKKKTGIVVDKHYVVALTNEADVVLAKIPTTATATQG